MLTQLNERSRYFHLHFQKIAQKYPDRIALRFDDKVLTYEELDKKSNQLARYLIRCGLGPEKIVAVALPRSLEAVVSVLAVMKAGAAFSILGLPIYENERVRMLKHFRYCLSVLRPDLVLIRSDIASILPSEISYPYYYFDDFDLGFAERMSEFSSASLKEEVSIIPNQLAYITFTSGSSGTPKGVEIEHEGLYERFFGMRDYLALRETDVVAQYARFDVDAALLDIMMALGSGAQLILVPPSLPISDIAEYFDKYKISIFVLTPTVLKALSPSKFNSRLRVLLTTGEDVMPESLDPWHGEGRLLINGYGPSEVTIATSLYSYKTRSKKMSIGRALIGLEMLVLNRTSYEPMLDGFEGELYIGGIGVGRAYRLPPIALGKAEYEDITKLNLERFLLALPPLNLTTTDMGNKIIEHPLATHYPAIKRWYRTGDKVMRDSEGNFVFLGRYDRQFKKLERLISPEVVEKEVLAYPLCEERKDCIAYYYPRGKNYWLVLALRIPGEISPNLPYKLSEFLIERINDHMLPQRWYITNSSLLNQEVISWKEIFPSYVRNNVSDSELVLANLKNSVTESNLTDTQNKLLAIWRRILLSPVEEASEHFKIGMHDSFTYLGGNSISYADLVTAFSENFPAVRFPELGFRRRPTIAYLSEVIEERCNYSPVFPFHVDTDKASLFLVHPLTGTVVGAYSEIVKLFSDRGVYGLQARGLNGTAIISETMEEMAWDYVQTVAHYLKARKNCILLGHSAGGIIAYEMGIQLKKMGYEPVVIMVDSLSPGYIQTITHEQSERLVTRMIDILLGLFRLSPLAKSKWYQEGLGHEAMLNFAYRALSWHVERVQQNYTLRVAKIIAKSFLDYKPANTSIPVYHYQAGLSDWYQNNNDYSRYQLTANRLVLAGKTHLNIVSSDELLTHLPRLLEMIEFPERKKLLRQVALKLRRRILAERISLEDFIAHDAKMSPLNEDRFSLDKSVTKFIQSKDPASKVFLLQGDSGSGKTFFVLKLISAMLQDVSMNFDLPLPVLIDYWPKDDVKISDWVEYYLKDSYGFDEVEYKTLRDKLSIIFIVDSYDLVVNFNTEGKLHLNNLYVSNQMLDWGLDSAKLLVTCRSQFLRDYNSYNSFFGYKPGDSTTVYLAEFNDKQIRQFVENTLGMEAPVLKQSYFSWLEKLPFLSTMASNPRILELMLKALRPIFKSNSTSGINKMAIFDAITGAWFINEDFRLNKLEIWRPQENQVEKFRVFSRNLAWQMILAGEETITYKPCLDNEPGFNCSKDERLWEVFFSDQKKALYSRVASLIKRSDDGVYSFLNDQVRIYFTAKYLQAHLGLNSPNGYSYNVSHAFNLHAFGGNESEVLHFLSDLVSATDNKSVAILDEIIAKEDPGKSKNAIYNAKRILDLVGISYSVLAKIEAASASVDFDVAGSSPEPTLVDVPVSHTPVVSSATRPSLFLIPPLLALKSIVQLNLLGQKQWSSEQKKVYQIFLKDGDRPCFYEAGRTNMPLNPVEAPSGALIPACNASEPWDPYVLYLMQQATRQSVFGLADGFSSGFCAELSVLPPSIRQGLAIGCHLIIQHARGYSLLSTVIFGGAREAMSYAGLSKTLSFVLLLGTQLIYEAFHKKVDLGEQMHGLLCLLLVGSLAEILGRKLGSVVGRGVDKAVRTRVTPHLFKVASNTAAGSAAVPEIHLTYARNR